MFSIDLTNSVMVKDNPYAARVQKSIVFVIPNNLNKLPSENATIQKNNRKKPGVKISACLILLRLKLVQLLKFKGILHPCNCRP